ncbi:MAG: hypothetical protein KC684_04620, partial [Candidatus Omnitrophica bacterium]|nr:hypothetical protein [Candidatus Omnitrophota bacterium]
MKAIKIILIILLVITVVALIAGFFVIKNFDLDKYRTDITEAASKSLNKKVELGQIVSRISWTKGIYLKV